VSPKDPEFQAIQRVTASGILKVKGESWKWANRTWFHPDTTLCVKEFAEGLNAFDNNFQLSDDHSAMNLKTASKMISSFLNKDVSIDIQQVWKSKLSRIYDPSLAVTKREMAVICDHLISPFKTRSIGFDGNFK
jgi:hypothetical protein